MNRRFPAAVVVMLCAAVGGLTSHPTPVTPQVQPLVFGVPIPLDPARDQPAPDELVRVLNGIADPTVWFVDKSDLIEDGVGPAEGNLADVGARRAARKGELPLSFTVSDIQPAGPGRARATVDVSGPRIPTVTKLLTFVDQGGWKLSHMSAMTLLQTASSSER